jgi:putative DNA primase/helicase
MARATGAISRTYLDTNLNKIGKAKTYCSPVGIVRLSRDEDVLQGLFIASGLETSLDTMAKNARPMWSMGSDTSMAKFPVLAGIEALSIIADHDKNGAGEKAARAAAARWLEAGREVRVKIWTKLGDANDAFRELEEP